MSAKAEDSSMVLRTVYLPKALDDELRKRAFALQCSKNELIRSAVGIAVTQWQAKEADLVAPRTGRARAIG